MSVEILTAGLQTTIQGAPRIGLRHFGVPASGAADPLSMALANRLVGNDMQAAALETTLTGVSLRFDRTSAIAVTGATAECRLNGDLISQHRTIMADCGDTLVVGPAEKGVRNYVAFAGALRAAEFLGSVSTYLPARFGGYDGRALMAGDRLQLVTESAAPGCRSIDIIETPDRFRPPMLDTWTLRAGSSAETPLLLDGEQLFQARFRIGNRNDRMGIELQAARLTLLSDGRMDSAAVFPGMVQCPQDGKPFLLSVDAQTTGGYPRVAKVTRADMHLIGQLRAGNRLSFLRRSDRDAAAELREKHRYWGAWLPEIASVI